MTSLNVPKNKIVNASNDIAEVAVLIMLLKDAYTYEHAPEYTDTTLALSAIHKLANKLNSDLFYLLNDENGEAKP
ncbi:hypothetical protein [Yersinia massiliensis]|uniref:hypothetical protein n=1 Tax=Yersinia massiliensis TaxID=419257 RepID=UPI0028D5C4F9|nr:hypothetical protein [Yersinia massiliensis]